jgi:hypothetical protein
MCKLAALHAVPGGEHDAGGVVLAKARHLVFLQHAEGLGGIIWTFHVGRVKDLTQLVARERVRLRRGSEKGSDPFLAYKIGPFGAVEVRHREFQKEIAQQASDRERRHRGRR